MVVFSFVEVVLEQLVVKGIGGKLWLFKSRSFGTSKLDKATVDPDTGLLRVAASFS